MSIHTTSDDEHQRTIAQLLKTREFDEAADFIATNIKKSQIIRVLHTLTEQDTGLLSYTFVNYILIKEESAFWHKVAACIATESLNHVVQGHNAGLFHILRAIELDPKDYLLKEYALGFYEEGLLTISMARTFAKEVLQHEAGNKQAARILESI